MSNNVTDSSNVQGLQGQNTHAPQKSEPARKCEQTFDLSIKILGTDGKTLTIQAYPSLTIYEIKQIIREKEGLPTHEQRLIIGFDQTLREDRTLESYGIREGRTIIEDRGHIAILEYQLHLERLVKPPSS